MNCKAGGSGLDVNHHDFSLHLHCIIVSACTFDISDQSNFIYITPFKQINALQSALQEVRLK